MKCTSESESMFFLKNIFIADCKYIYSEVYCNTFILKCTTNTVEASSDLQSWKIGAHFNVFADIGNTQVGLPQLLNSN